jgi:uncharacterized protein YbaR (Trm112 family)
MVVACPVCSEPLLITEDDELEESNLADEVFED